MTRKIKIQKRLILFFATIVVSIACSFAQDIITLKDGREITALVYEIGDFDVKYKKVDNPYGTTYTLRKSEILMIKYANGSKDIFTDYTVPAEVPMPAPIAEQPRVQHQVKTSLDLLSISEKEIYDSYGVKLSKNEVRNRMRNVPEALNLYNSGKSLKGTGTFFNVVGVGCLVGSIIQFGRAADKKSAEDEARADYRWDDAKDYETERLDLAYSGLYLLGGSLVSFTIGASCHSSGNKKINNSVAVYNRGIRQKYTSDVTLNFGITRTGGIGLTLNF